MIIVSWILFLIWGGLVYLHHVLIAYCFFGLMLLIRNTKPKAPRLSARAGKALIFGFIAFLVLALIDAYYPFPASIHIVGVILAFLILCPLFFYGVSLDYKAFNTTPDQSA